MTTDERTGGCLCKNIRYALTGEPVWVVQCFCRDCQLATGTGHTTIAAFDFDQQASVQGRPKEYSTQGDSGGTVTRHFCENCGSRLFTTSNLSGPLAIFQCGTLDEPGSVTPTSAIYMKDRIGWDHVEPSLRQYEMMNPDIVYKADD